MNTHTRTHYTVHMLEYLRAVCMHYKSHSHPLFFTCFTPPPVFSSSTLPSSVPSFGYVTFAFSPLLYFCSLPFFSFTLFAPLISVPLASSLLLSSPLIFCALVSFPFISSPLLSSCLLFACLLSSFPLFSSPLLLPMVQYSIASQLHSSICPITPERQSGTVLSVIRPCGGPVRATRWNASPFWSHHAGGLWFTKMVE